MSSLLAVVFGMFLLVCECVCCLITVGCYLVTVVLVGYSGEVWLVACCGRCWFVGFGC